MREIKEVLGLSLEEALREAIEIRKSNFRGMSQIHLVNGYLLGKRCAGDCKFCGWNCNVGSTEERLKLNSKTLKAVINAACREGINKIEIINNTVWITRKLMDELKSFSWACKECSVGVSIGLCKEEKRFQMLKDLGFSWYVNDIETSFSIYPSVVTTHEWRQKLVAMELCKKVGLSLHSGFILGLGEGERDLEEIYSVFKQFKVEAIVINFYSYVNGVYLKSISMSAEETLRRLAQLRIIFPNTSIVLGGGRTRWLGEEFIAEAFSVVDTIYARSFLNHSNPYWLREGEILSLLNKEGLI